jgi:hypothetical protein
MAYRSPRFQFSFEVRALLLSLALGASIGCGGQQATPESAEPAAAAPAAAESPGAAPAASSDATRAGRASIFAVHQFANFDEFVKFFDQGAADRAKVGVKGHLLSRLEDGRVVIHLFADNVETVDAALKSPEMVTYISRRGSPETSLVWLTRDVVVKIPPAPPKGETYSLYLKLKVGNFAELESAFRALEKVFGEQSVIAEGLHRATVNEDIAILHFVGTDKHALEDLVKRKEFVELLKVAQVEGEVKPLVGVDVSRERPK